MNANRLISMVVRMVLRPLISRGINAGIDAVSGREKRRSDRSDEERKQAADAKGTTQNARRTIRMARRIGRM